MGLKRNAEHAQRASEYSNFPACSDENIMLGKDAFSDLAHKQT